VMADEALRVEFKVALGNRRRAPEAPFGAKLERQRLDRAARRARNLALAYWIDHLIRTGQATDLAAVARMCGVSRCRVSKIVTGQRTPVTAQERLLEAAPFVR
jgi:hypothetical protein